MPKRKTIYSELENADFRRYSQEKLIYVYKANSWNLLPLAWNMHLSGKTGNGKTSIINEYHSENIAGIVKYFNFLH